MKKKKNKQELEIKQKWYEDLLKDIKEFEFKGIILTKHKIGKRILEENEKFGKPEYGSKRIENIAKDLNLNSRDLYMCLQFAKKYPEIEPVVQNLSWRKLREELQEHKPRPEIQQIEGKYNIIYADPPWKYYEGGDKNQSQHYNTLEFEDIRDRIGEEVKKIAAEDCILFLWITDPMLDKIKELVNAWGFKYSTVGFYWIKKTKENKNFFGLGNWTRANPEICIIATKGSIERKDASISKIIETQIEEHSKKPVIIRNKIIQLVGDLPRIELFARSTGDISEKGWKMWGSN